MENRSDSGDVRFISPLLAFLPEKETKYQDHRRIKAGQETPKNRSIQGKKCDSAG